MVAEALVVERLRKRYGAREVLGVDTFRVHAGECVALIGPNGSGKTTFLKIAAGLLRPDSCGRLEILGSRRLPVPGAVYLHQNPYLFEGTVRDNIGYGLKARGVWSQRRVDEAISWAGLELLAGSDREGLSGGEVRRVALARMWALNPRFYLLDEPAAHMDAEGDALIEEILSTTRANGGCAVICAPDEKAASGADRACVLSGGDIVPLQR